MVFMHCKFRAVTSHWWFHVNQIQLQLNWQKLTDQSSTHNVIQYFFFNHSVVSEWKLEIGHRNNTACSKLNLVQSSRSKSTSWQQPAWEKGVSGCSVLNQAAQFFYWDASSSDHFICVEFEFVLGPLQTPKSRTAVSLYQPSSTILELKAQGHFEKWKSAVLKCCWYGYFLTTWQWWASVGQSLQQLCWSWPLIG